MRNDYSSTQRDRSSDDPMDRVTIERLRNGDESALCEVIETYQALLFRYVVSSLRSPEIAEDVLQDVFIQLWNTRERIDSTLSIRQYLYRIARNKTFDALSSSAARSTREARVSREDRFIIESPIAAIEEQEFDVALQQAISELPDRCREIFFLVRSRDMTYAEVADTLGIAVSTVKTQMGRAMASLATRLAPFLLITVSVRMGGM